MYFAKNIVSKTIIAAVLACAVVFTSCGSKDVYEGKKVVVDYDSSAKLIIVPMVNESGEITEQAAKFPLELYKAEEAKLKELAGIYNSYSGIKKSYGTKLKNCFSDVAENNSFQLFVEDENELENIKSWYRDSKKKYYDALEYSHDIDNLVNFHNALYADVKVIVSLLEDVNEYNEDPSWYDSLEALFDFNKEESAAPISRILSLFPEVKFITDFADVTPLEVKGE